MSEHTVKAVISIDDLAILADGIAELDSLKNYAISTETGRIGALAARCYGIIEHTAGEYAPQIFATEEHPA